MPKSSSIHSTRGTRVHTLDTSPDNHAHPTMHQPTVH